MYRIAVAAAYVISLQRRCKGPPAQWDRRQAAPENLLALPGGRATLAIKIGHETTVDRLRAVDQLHGLTTPQLRQVAAMAERVLVDKGEVLAKEGRVGREFFLILSGTVAVTQGGRYIDTLGPGRFFGEMIATKDGARHATVTALSDVDVLIIGPRESAAMFDIPGFRDAMPLAIATSRNLSTTVARVASSTEDGGKQNIVVQRLKGIPWFAACTDEQLAEIEHMAERLRVLEGEVILREGRLGRELYVILEGTVVISRAGRTIIERGPGDYFGELAAIDAAPRSATVTAKTDLDVLIIGPRELGAMMDIPGFRDALLAGMTGRIRAADDELAAMAEEEEQDRSGS